MEKKTKLIPVTKESTFLDELKSTKRDVCCKNCGEKQEFMLPPLSSNSLRLEIVIDGELYAITNHITADAFKLIYDKETFILAIVEVATGKIIKDLKKDNLL